MLKWMARGWAVVALIVAFAVPLLVAQWQLKSQKHFRVVRDGVFYRSGQMDVTGLKNVVLQHGIRTVITLRDSETPGAPPPDAAEEAWCRKEEIQYVRLTPKAWEAPNAEPPVVSNIQIYLDVLDRPESYPILVHCNAGIHRTGAYTALYRIEKEGWPLERAMNEMRALGYDRLDEELDIKTFFDQYFPGKWRPKKAPK